MGEKHRVRGACKCVCAGTSGSNRSGHGHYRWTAVFWLLLIGPLSIISVSAGENGSDPIAVPDGTSTCTFIPERSNVQNYIGFTGNLEIYPIEGQFVLSVDLRARTAVFRSVNANMLTDSQFMTNRSLGRLFNTAELHGTVVNDARIGFQGNWPGDWSQRIILNLTFTREGVRVSGDIPWSGDPDASSFLMEGVAKYDPGTGTADDPYRIYTAEQIDAIGADPNLWDKRFRLMADLDLSGYGDGRFHPIGLPQKPFRGVFDGNGHTISNFSSAKVPNWSEYAGLFGYIAGPQAEVRNLVLADPNVGSGEYWDFTLRYAGALAGELHQGTISNCHVRNGIVGGGDYVGGLVGINRGTIQDSHFRGTLRGSLYVGGLVGCNAGSLLRCYATSVVLAGGSAGGLAGSTDGVETEATHPSGRAKIASVSDETGSIVTDCYATGYVRGADKVAGLVGDNSGIIRRCYSTCCVSAKSNHCGGLVWSDNPASTVEACFWDVETSGVEESVGGERKTTAEMKTSGTFLNAGWDFAAETANGTEDVWQILEGEDYPRLRWEHDGHL